MKKNRKPKYYVAQVGGVNNISDPVTAQFLQQTDPNQDPWKMYDNGRILNPSRNRNSLAPIPQAPINTSNALPAQPTPIGGSNPGVNYRQPKIGVPSYLDMFNGVAKGVTSIADQLSDNQLNKRENQDLIRTNQRFQQAPQGPLNTNPAYTKYGGKGKYQAGGYDPRYPYLTPIDPAEADREQKLLALTRKGLDSDKAAARVAKFLPKSIILDAEGNLIPNNQFIPPANANTNNVIIPQYPELDAHPHLHPHVFPQRSQYGGHYQIGGQNDEQGEESPDDEQYENDNGDDILEMMKAGGWIKKAVNPAHKGYCTPMTKSTCTPHRKAFAMTMKKHHGFHKAQVGGNYTPNPPTYNMLPVEDPKGKISKKDSLSYLQSYNLMRNNPALATEDYEWLNKNIDVIKDQRLSNYGYNRMTAYEDALQPGTMKYTLPPDTKKPSKKQLGGQAITIDKKKLQAQAKGNPYLTDSNKRYYWGELMNRDFPNSGGNVRQGVLDAAKQNNINPNLLYASAMEEGMAGAIDSKESGFAGEDYNKWTDANPDKASKYPVDGFYNYGLDQFAGQSKALEQKGYLPKGFSTDAFTTYKTKNEKNEQLDAPAFTSDQNALMAKSAMMRQAGDQLDSYAKQKNIKLSDKQKQFFTLANYNGGEGNMQKMLGSYQEKGYLNNDKFIDDVNFKPSAYNQIYNNVQARLQSAKLLQNNNYFAQPSQTAQIVPAAQSVASTMQKGGALYNDVSQYEIDNNLLMQAGGDIQKVKGLLPSQEASANVEAERGEVYTDNFGNMNQVDPHGATHEQGGEMLPQVHRVLENTSNIRKDKISKFLKLTPDQVKALTGLDAAKSMSHAEALIEGANALENQRLKIVKNIGLASKNRQNIDTYAENSTKLNIDHFRAIPTKDELFNRLFDHQEMTKSALGISNDGEQAKKGGKPKYKAFNAYQAGGITAYQGNTSGQTTPAGNSDAFQGNLNDYLANLKANGFNFNNINTNADLQKALYTHELKNNPQAIRNMWQEGIQNYGVDKAIKAGLVYDKDDPTKNIKRGQFKPGVLDNSENLQKLATLYPDNLLGRRILNLSKDNGPKVWTDQNLPPQPTQGQPDINNPTGSITNNLKLKSSPSSNFNEPLRWYDTASAENTYMSSLRRLPENYNPVDVHQLNLKLLDPTANLRSNQQDFNAALQSVQQADPTNVGAQMANIANLTSRKYALNNQVMGNFENQNAAVKNQEITYNTQAKDRQSVADQNSREVYSEKVLTSKAKQQEQKLTALDSLYKTIAENAALNRNGNLIMKMSRAFDQYGEYNGYAPNFQPNPQLGISANPATNANQPTGKFQPAGGIQGLTPGKSYYNRRTGKTLKYDGTNLVEVK